MRPPQVRRNRTGLVPRRLLDIVVPSRWNQFLCVSLASLSLTSIVTHGLAHWSELPRSSGSYRRVGPVSGPQVFCAGSSLLVSSLSWDEVSRAFGQGIETWTLGGSSPDIWELFELRSRPSNTTIFGVSVYDLNEMRIAADRPMVVPLSSSISNLLQSGAEYPLMHRIVSQHALAYIRLLFPVAGDADRLLPGIRRKGAELLGRQASLDDHEGVLIQQRGVLDAGDWNSELSKWPPARLQRRLASLRAENLGRHEFFRGPKRVAFHRMLSKAARKGTVIVMVLPISKAYREEFLNESTVQEFERAIGEVKRFAPSATLLRFDRLPALSDHAYYADLVHLNSRGRNVITPALLSSVVKGSAPDLQSNRARTQELK